jgi:hypothetical protein
MPVCVECGVSQKFLVDNLYCDDCDYELSGDEDALIGFNDSGLDYDDEDGYDRDY